MLQGQKLQQAYNDYINNYSIEKGLMPKSIKNKKQVLAKIIPFLEGKSFTLETCREYSLYLYSNGWDKPTSREHIIKILRAFINFLYKHKYIDYNFAQDLIKPKIPRRNFDYVDPETVEKIIIAGTTPGLEDNSRNKAIKAEMRVALRFILRTGLRIGELIALRSSDLNLYDNPPTFWVLSKGGDRELLPLPLDMVEELKLRVQKDKIFSITAETCNDVLKRGAKALGLPVALTNHSLRHIFASNLVKNKVPIQMVSRLMRHSSVEITDKTYTHLNVNDLSLILNSKQAVVQKGLTIDQVFVHVESLIKNSSVGKDNRLSLKIVKNNKLLQITIRSN